MKITSMLDSEIILGKGFVDIQVGQPILKIRNQILAKPNKWKIELNPSVQQDVPDFVDYVFDNAIRFRVNLYLGKIASISIFNDFRGAFFQDYGIGTMVSELQESDKFELNFDEHYILVNNNELILTLDNDQEFIDAWEDIEFNTIETIMIEHPTYNRMSFDSSELEKLWEAR